MKEILKRIEDGKCLICAKELGNINPESLKELRAVTYEGKEALICKRHHYEKMV